MNLSSIKKNLHQKCLSIIEDRIKNTQDAMSEAQNAANQESKSSAGDKYETGRAMMQIQRDNNARQLSEILKLHQILLQINPSQKSDQVQMGSLVRTNRGVFFIAISIGKLTDENQSYFVISLATPLGKKLKGCKKGDAFYFHDQHYVIEQVF